MMNYCKLHRRFALYGFILSYIFGNHYIDMGLDEKYAVVLSTSSLVFCIIGVFGLLEHLFNGVEK